MSCKACGYFIHTKIERPLNLRVTPEGDVEFVLTLQQALDLMEGLDAVIERHMIQTEEEN